MTFPDESQAPAEANLFLKNWVPVGGNDAPTITGGRTLSVNIGVSQLDQADQSEEEQASMILHVHPDAARALARHLNSLADFEDARKRNQN